MISSTAIMARRENLLGKAYRLFYDDPVHIVKGEGVWLYDQAGQRYLDCYNNVPHVGHCHPHVVDAICAQVRTLNTHTRYLHETVLDYAQMLTDRFPDPLNMAMFACTGTEANELALRIARAATGNEGMIAVNHAYHGNSWAIAQITEDSDGGEPKCDNIEFVPCPNPYRGHHQAKGIADENCSAFYLESVRQAISRLQKRGHGVCALIVDTIFSSNGLPEIPAGYLEAAVKMVREAGGIFVADEVQAGFGRTGTHFWGYEHYDLVPDMVTMGKPMGNGHPVSAVVTRADIIDEFGAQFGYFNTFGGNPVSCAAARAVLEVMDKEQLQRNALEVGAYLRENLRKLSQTHDLIGDIRGRGLFNGIDLVEDRISRRPARDAARIAVNHLRHNGILLGASGPDSNVLKIRSPLVFSKDNTDQLIGGLDKALLAARE